MRENMMRGRKPILLVEDDVVDAMTVERALRDLSIANRLEIVDDGEAALDFLNDPKNQKPCIILLDLNMPRMNGIEFLEIVKRDKSLKGIPVVILTTSKEERDKALSFDLGVVGYIVKPADYMQFIEAVRTIDLYWTLSEIPGEA
jgi:CheY-like chemotaxis protein